MWKKRSGRGLSRYTPLKKMPPLLSVIKESPYHFCYLFIVSLLCCGLARPSHLRVNLNMTSVAQRHKVHGIIHQPSLFGFAYSFFHRSYVVNLTSRGQSPVSLAPLAERVCRQHLTTKLHPLITMNQLDVIIVSCHLCPSSSFV